MQVRLQKFMADAGIASRRSCEKLILQGRVKLNGRIVKEMGVKVNLESDRVEVDGKICRRNFDLLYIVLNKPKGIISTAKDPFKRTKVVDLIEGVRERVYPVGRLDKDTEGLLILTNDGDATYRITHPKHKIDKIYIAQVKGIIGPKALVALREGVNLEDGLTAPAKVKLLKFQADTTVVEISIHEGRNRQVRRMFEVVRHPVINLKRIGIGELKLKNLKTGDWRFMTQKEIDYIKSL